MLGALRCILCYSNAQAIIKLTMLLPNEALHGTLVHFLKQLSDYECSRAITGQ